MLALLPFVTFFFSFLTSPFRNSYCSSARMKNILSPTSHKRIAALQNITCPKFAGRSPPRDESPSSASTGRLKRTAPQKEKLRTTEEHLLPPLEGAPKNNNNDALLLSFLRRMAGPLSSCRHCSCYLHRRASGASFSRGREAPNAVSLPARERETVDADIETVFFLLSFFFAFFALWGARVFYLSSGGHFEHGLLDSAVYECRPHRVTFCFWASAETHVRTKKQPYEP